MSISWAMALIIGGLIIAGLSFYLGQLLLLLKRSRQQQAQKTAQRNEILRDSIYTIAWAMRDGQCEYSEGCLRVWVLLDHYSEQPQPDNQQRYPGVFNLYERVKDLPTHSKRKKLKKPELRAMDQQRFADEAQFKAAIEKDLNKLTERFKPA